MTMQPAGTQLPRHLISTSVAQTLHIAGELTATLTGGECIALNGELGAGKTQFVRGLVSALGGSPRAVSSPTYVLLNVYETPRFAVYHLDAYRVGGAEDFEAIGFTELLEQGGIVIVEWAQRVAGLLPARRIEVNLTATSPRRRRIEIAWLTQASPEMREER